MVLVCLTSEINSVIVDIYTNILVYYSIFMHIKQSFFKKIFKGELMMKSEEFNKLALISFHLLRIADRVDYKEDLIISHHILMDLRVKNIGGVC